ncbi:MAG: ROK family protein [Actinomycetota bacterium]|nr:ROK family protein [Actinomycetota bacterium]MDG2120170.1 ROK family protein [Actinomycetota bacterium]
MATGSNQVALAVDIGGTKLAAGLVDRAGELLWSSAALTLVERGAEDIFGTLSRLLDKALKASSLMELTPIVVGAGCGGPMVLGGEDVSPLNIPSWRRFPLKRALQKYCGLEAFVDNDAKAIALAEAWAGAAKDTKNFIGMVVSTGVGGGLVVDGKLLGGEAGNAGHIGHVIVEPEGADCACGAKGCLEAEVSGLSIERRIGMPAEFASLEERKRAGCLTGRAIACSANLLDLKLAVIGGSVALGFGSVFFASAQKELDRLACLDFSFGSRVVPAALGEKAPLIGAAAVGFSGLGIVTLGD